jgi:1,2-diacylglycerol 3-alpha-glucosyltransferase
MRIGLFTDQFYPQISGVVTSIKMLYEGLESLGHECYIFTAIDDENCKDHPELKNKKIINFPGIHYPFKAAKDYKYNIFRNKFCKEVAKYNLDVIHINTEFNMSAIARKAAKKLKIPVVYTMHTAWIQYICTLFPRSDKFLHPLWVKVMQILFTKPTYKSSTLTILPTKKIIPDLKDYGIKGKDFRIIPTGIELHRFTDFNAPKEELDALKEKLGLKDKFIFSYIGRTAKEKNLDFLISSFEKVVSKNDKARLLIVGGGPVLEELKEHSKSLNISDKVVFTGLIPWEEIPYYYHISDVFVSASKSETQGLTYIEALASGVPVLVQNDLCIEGVIEEGVNGFVFNNEEEFVNKMNYCLDNDLSEIIKNTEPSSTKFSKEKFAENILGVYQEAIEIFNSKCKKKKNKN